MTGVFRFELILCRGVPIRYCETVCDELNRAFAPDWGELPEAGRLAWVAATGLVVSLLGPRPSLIRARESGVSLVCQP